MDDAQLTNIISELTHARLTRRQWGLVMRLVDEIRAAQEGRVVGWKCPNCAHYNARVCAGCGYESK